MKCPVCASDHVKVLDTRIQKEIEMLRDGGIARRRRCLDCGVTYRTLETVTKIMREPGKPGRPKRGGSDALNWDSLDIWNRNDITSSASEIGAGSPDAETD